MKILLIVAIATVALSSCAKEAQVSTQETNSRVFFRVESISAQGDSTYSETISINK